MYGLKVTACKLEATPPAGRDKDESISEHFGGRRWAGYHQGSVYRHGEVPLVHEVRRFTMADRVSIPSLQSYTSVDMVGVVYWSKLHMTVFQFCSASDGLEIWVVELNERDVVSSCMHRSKIRERFA